MQSRMRLHACNKQIKRTFQLSFFNLNIFARTCRCASVATQPLPRLSTEVHYIVIIYSFSAAPSAPTGVRVTSILRDSVTLAWDKPEHDGGLPITGYVIERQDTRRGGWTTITTVDPHTYSYKVPKLLEGNEYYFRVLAENPVGVGAAFETPQAIEVKSPYGTFI